MPENLPDRYKGYVLSDLWTTPGANIGWSLLLGAGTTVAINKINGLAWTVLVITNGTENALIMVNEEMRRSEIQSFKPGWFWFLSPCCFCLRCCWSFRRRAVEVTVPFQGVQLSHGIVMVRRSCEKTEKKGLVGCSAIIFSLTSSFFSSFLSLHANSFCIVFLSLLSASCTQQFTFCLHLAHTCFRPQHPVCVLFPSSTDSFTTGNRVTLNVPSTGKS